MKKERTRQSSPPSRSRSEAMPWVLLLPFFLSGATSLALEVAWSKVLSYLLGVDLYASATVVTAYMAGIGLGAYLSGRLPFALASLAPDLCRAAGNHRALRGDVRAAVHATEPLFCMLYGRSFASPHLFLLLRFLVVLAA